MGKANDRTYLIWSLTSSGIGTTISGNGNSGSYTATAQNARTAVDLRYGWADDLEIMVYVTGITSTPSLVAGLGIYDAQGNLYKPSALAATAVTSAAGSSLLAIGRHGATAGTYINVPEWGQVYWTCSGGTATGVEISLYGR